MLLFSSVYTILSTNDFTQIKNDLHYHTHRACAKLRRLKMKANVVGLMLRTKDFRVIVEKFTLPMPSNCEFEIYKVIDDLLARNFNSATLYRSSGVYLENLIAEQEEQLSIFAQGENKQRKIATICDLLKDRYGHKAVNTGCY